MKKILLLPLLSITVLCTQSYGMERQPSKIQETKKWIASWFAKQPSLEQQKAQLIAEYDAQIQRVNEWLHTYGTPDDISGKTGSDMWRFSQNLLHHKQELMDFPVTIVEINSHKSLLEAFKRNIDAEYTPAAIQSAQIRKQQYQQKAEQIERARRHLQETNPELYAELLRKNPHYFKITL